MWLQEAPAAPEPGREEAEAGDENFVYIPRVNAEVCAGHGAEPPQVEILDEPYAFRRDWLQREGLRPEHLVVTTAVGDSMRPTIDHHDILLVETFQSLTDGTVRPEFFTGPPPEGIYVLGLHYDLVVKRLQPTVRGGLLLLSDNSEYRTMEVEPDDIMDLHMVGRVVWVGHRI